MKMNHESNFDKDSKAAEKGESIALQVLQNATDDYVFYDVSNIEKFYHKGDIVARNLSDDSPSFIDVKDDSCIYKSGNILCEEKVYYKKNHNLVDGFMYSGYDYLAIVSQPENKIYIVDFNGLKKHYKEGRYLKMEYSWQWSDTYLFPLSKARKYGILLYEIEYECIDGSDPLIDGEDIYVPLKVNKIA